VSLPSSQASSGSGSGLLKGLRAESVGSVGEQEVKQRLDELCQYCYILSARDGAWGDDPYKRPQRNIAEAIALIHEELSKALGAHRQGMCTACGNESPPAGEASRAPSCAVCQGRRVPMSDSLPGFTAFEEALAAVMIRVCELACGTETRLAEAALASIRRREGEGTND